MADDKSFKELIEQSKKTNKLLEQQMASEDKGAKLGASIKNAAGEIINDQLIGRTAKREADETQTAIKKSGETIVEALSEPTKKDKENTKIWKGISETLTGAFVRTSMKVGTAKSEEQAKDQLASFRAFGAKYFGKGSFLGRQLGGLKDFMSGLFKNLLGKGKGLLGFLIKLSVFGLFLKYINSEGFKEFMKNDAPQRIAEAARKLFGKEGFFTKLNTALFGDGEKDSGKIGLLGHLLAIVGGFMGLTEKTGWQAVKDALGALKRTIFGGEKSTTYGDSGDEEPKSLLGGLSNLSKIMLGIAAAMALPAIIKFMPGLFVKGGLMLLGFVAIVEAIKAVNEMLGVNADMLDEETGRLDKSTPRVENVIPPVRTYGYNMFSEQRPTVRSSKGLISYASPVDNKAIGEKVKPIDKVRHMLKRFPSMKGLSKIFGMPFIGKALIGLQALDILQSDMPDEGPPNRPSKKQSLYGLLGSGAGMAFGGILGSLAIPLPFAGTALGTFLGGLVGQEAGLAAYEYLWLKDKGASGEQIRDIFSRQVGSFFSGGIKNTTDKMIPVMTYTPDASGVTGAGTMTPTGEMKLNPHYIDTQSMTSQQYIRHLIPDVQFKNQGYSGDSPVIINNQNNSSQNNSTFLGNKQIKDNSMDDVFVGG